MKCNGSFIFGVIIFPFIVGCSSAGQLSRFPLGPQFFGGTRANVELLLDEDIVGHDRSVMGAVAVLDLPGSFILDLIVSPVTCPVDLFGLLYSGAIYELNRYYIQEATTGLYNKAYMRKGVVERWTRWERDGEGTFDEFIEHLEDRTVYLDFPFKGDKNEAVRYWVFGDEVD